MTFREPEAARRACADPTPFIDGRRANCNLASLGRPRPQVLYGIISIVFSWPLCATDVSFGSSIIYCIMITFLIPVGRLRPATLFSGSTQATRGPYIGSFGYQQPLPYNYQQGMVYPSYG